MTIRHFYAEIGYAENNFALLADYLAEHPLELLAYQVSMMHTINGTMSGGDYRSAPEAFALMCHVLAAVRRILGEYVLD